MNIREIKLALTVKLMNLETGHYLTTIQELMQHFVEQVGAFLGVQVLNDSMLDQGRSMQKVALQYENCTLNLDLIQDNTTQHQFINRFELV